MVNSRLNSCHLCTVGLTGTNAPMEYKIYTCGAKSSNIHTSVFNPSYVLKKWLF